MSKIRELLRLKFDSHLSHRDIASCLSIGHSTVSELLTRFKTSSLSWPLPEGCSVSCIPAGLKPKNAACVSITLLVISSSLITAGRPSISSIQTPEHAENVKPHQQAHLLSPRPNLRAVH